MTATQFIQTGGREGGGQTLALSPLKPVGQSAYHNREIANRVSPTRGAANGPYSFTYPESSPVLHCASTRQTRGCAARIRITDREEPA
jgi:hypothetical protein